MINLRDSNDIGEVESLLSECMWSDEERVNAEVTKYLEDSDLNANSHNINDYADTLAD